MAKKKSTAAKSKTKNTKEANFLNFGESYTSLILGIVVVIITSILLISFVRNRGDVQPIQTDTPDISSTSIGPETEDEEGDSYTVEAGQGLWQIAEERYGSGYNWVDIARANNITNPDQIVAGAVLVLPDVEPKERTVVEAIQDAREALAQRVEERGGRIETTKYTVVEGDTLWSIAERKYGDGFVFAKIASDNRVSNPSVIYVGQVIELPNLPNAPNSN